MQRLFGTDGIRGEAGKFPLDNETVRIAGRSLAEQLTKTLGRAPRLVSGRDTRESGVEIETSFIAGAISGGATCESAGVITTPGVAFLARSLPADAGIVFSASHNPYHDNGIKIFEPTGRKLDDGTERLIERDIEAALASKTQQVEHLSKKVEASSKDDYAAEALRSRYADFLTREIGAGVSLEGLNVVIDCANGAAFELAPRVFASLGARVTAIANKPDGRNINRGCGSLHTEILQARVLQERADIGIAYDGDADRALFVDANGDLVDGDATLWVLASRMSDDGELNGDTVVATVMSNIGLEIALRRRGIALVRTDVGDKYVLERLLETGATLGGEQSGHIIFPRVSLAGDGIITSILLLRVMRKTGRSLAKLVAGFERYPQVLVNVPVREKRPFASVEPVAQIVETIESRLEGRGRLLLRYSGTESLARVMIEGEHQAEIEAMASEIASAIRANLGDA